VTSTIQLQTFFNNLQLYLPLFFNDSAKAYTEEPSALGNMFVHASIRTGNMEKSIGFYTKHLGLTVVSRREIPQNRAEIVFLRDPEGKGATLELTFYRDQERFVQADYEDRIFDHLAFEIQNMDKTLAGMRKDGVTVTDEPYRLSPNGSLIAFVEDPDGTLIELIETK
jgi:lactoylglutathione lyase